MLIDLYWIKFLRVSPQLKDNNGKLPPLLLSKNMILRRRRGGRGGENENWLLRSISLDDNEVISSRELSASNDVLIYEEIVDIEKIVQTLNEVFGCCYSEMKEFCHHGLITCLTSTDTIRIVVPTGNPSLVVHIDTVKLSPNEDKFTTIGTIKICHSNNSNNNISSTEDIDSRETFARMDQHIVSVKLCGSKFVQSIQLTCPTVYEQWKSLISTNKICCSVEQHLFTVDESKISDRFLFGIPIRIGSEEFLPMLAFYYELYSSRVLFGR